ncbi:MAG: NAD(P)/FAD-dependent oxidoreductase [Candidatus Thorarchaeota archaeon]
MIVVGGGPAGSATAINCASAGKDVLLLEKGERGRHKTCGGVLPLVAPETIEDIVNAQIPGDVKADPPNLGLYYIPPSGKENGGRVQGYNIHNIERDRFDQWLRNLAEGVGVEVRYDAEMKELRLNANHEVIVDSGGSTVSAKSEYLVGADGSRSSVRRFLYPDEKTPLLLVEQEHWKAKGDFEDCFYGFFRDDISIAYAYVIPKGNSLILGLGAVPHQEPSTTDLLKRFKTWLNDEFSFSAKELLKREVWAIPFGYFLPGRNKTLLVGDAAGLCNPLSGEGIRLAVESAEAAAAAITSHKSQDAPISSYKRDIRGIVNMVEELNRFVQQLDNAGRERFVRDELSRGRT